MPESSAAPRGTARHARPLPPAVRAPRIRPLAPPVAGAGAPAPGDSSGTAARGGHGAAVATVNPGTPAHARRPAERPAPHRAAAARPVRHPRAACTPPAATHPSEADHRAGRAERAELAGRFALRLVEVLIGLRPAGQLQRHTTLDGYGRLTALVRSGPLRRRAATTRPRLGRVHDSAPSADVVEVCVRVELGARHHVVAFRLEQHRRTGQWQCAAVESR